MRAVRLSASGYVSVTEVATPTPGHGEVLLSVLAAGVCHSDIHVIDSAARLHWPLPFTLGHEVCGEVTAVGPEVAGVQRGDQVLVYAPTGCGTCRRCAAGAENYCDRQAEQQAAGVGLGRDGGMADALVTEARRLVPIPELDPVSAAPLSDAGLTSLHALAACRPLDADTVAVVVGVGGLGHVAIQLLRARTAATVLAVDTRPAALELALRCGAHEAALAGADAQALVRTAAAGRGADAVFDFVAAAPTVEFSASVLAPGAELVLLGGGGGQLHVAKPGLLPPGVRVALPYWGTYSELAEVARMARTGALKVETHTYPLNDATQALDDLRHGRIDGRAVLVP